MMIKPTNLKYLNLGCGHSFHREWTNIDFVNTGEGVIKFDLRKGIPMKNNAVKVIYNSHVLEHFTKENGKKFIQECFRVLESKGLIRIVVPNLEDIVKSYIIFLKKSLDGDKKAEYNYEWMMLELFDQIVRQKSGGGMIDYFKQKNIPNKKFIFSRIGSEALNINASIATNKKISFKNIIIKKLETLLPFFHKFRIGHFRNQGEIHQWMYDRFSLSKLLKECGFTNIKVTDAFNSQIPDWERYQFLDVINNRTRKPDSLFMEAIKP